MVGSGLRDVPNESPRCTLALEKEDNIATQGDQSS